jgi:hypothetical protein
MPVLWSRTTLEVARGLKLFLRLEGGAVRGALPETTDTQGEAFEQTRKDMLQQHQSLEQKDKEIEKLRAALEERSSAAGVSPDNLVWVFGSGKTGSTWLSHMLKDLRDHVLWPEPDVGKLFGNFYYLQARDDQRQGKGFIMSESQRKTWLKSIRAFVLEGANGRFPSLDDTKYLVIKEPHGSIGASLLVEALPESRMILLVRDPRDTVASAVGASKGGGWNTRGIDKNSVALAVNNPNALVTRRAEIYVQGMESARKAYELHKGRKTIVRYEDLMDNTLDEMKRLCAELALPIGGDELAQVVEKHAWHSIPEDKKGEGKFYRKATPGGWREDLTPEQVKIVEEKTASLLEEFYPFAE